MKKFIIIFLLSTSCYSSTWECINRSLTMCNTWRMSVFTGWVVASDNMSTGGEHGYAMTFVPDADHKWKLQ